MDPSPTRRHPARKQATKELAAFARQGRQAMLSQCRKEATMLVVSRRPNDRIVFPKLGITVHVVRVEGRSVRLGIDAPRDVRVLRHEIADRDHEEVPPEIDEAAAAKRRHDRRNKLNTALLGLHLLSQKLKLQPASAEEFEPMLARVIRELESLDAG